MNTNTYVEKAEILNIAGRDVNIYNQVPNQSGSTEIFHELGKGSFSFSAVTNDVCEVQCIWKVHPGESVNYTYQTKSLLDANYENTLEATLLCLKNCFSENVFNITIKNQEP